jgi:hypothetical protein
MPHEEEKERRREEREEKKVEADIYASAAGMGRGFVDPSRRTEIFQKTTSK